VTSSSLVALMMLADGRLPVGGHTQSAGLEPALRAGLSAAQVPGFIATRLRTAVTVDAATAVVSRHHVTSGTGLGAAQSAWAARTPSEVTRAASVAVGRGCLRLPDRSRWERWGRPPG
jgi:urease accessory protein